MNLTGLYNDPRIYLALAAFLFAVGIFGLVRRRTLVGMIIAGELIFSSAALNIMALNRFSAPDPTVGQIAVLVIMGLAAAEVAVALSVIIAVYRNYRSIEPRQLTDLRG